MKHLSALPLLLAATWAVTVSPAHAASSSAQFDVVVNLSSACELTTLPTASFTYTSFQPSAATFSSSVGIRCTNGLKINRMTLDDPNNPTNTNATSVTITDADTDLSYTLTLGAVPTDGTGLPQNVAVTGTMAAGQSGTCSSSTCSNANSANRRRTLTIHY